MNPEKIRFNCPSCGIQLDVPAALAGVTGPCPSCQSSITAPHPQSQAPIPQQPVFPSEPPAQPQQPATTIPQEVPQETPPQEIAPSQAYREPIPPATPETQEQPRTAQTAPPAREEIVFPTVVPPPPAQPEVHPIPDEAPFPIEPTPIKGLPENRSSDGLASHQPEELAPSSSGKAPTPTKQSSRIPSLLFLLATLILMTIAVFAILSYTGAVGFNPLKSLFGLDKSQPAEQASPTAPPSAVETLPPQKSSEIEIPPSAFIEEPALPENVPPPSEPAPAAPAEDEEPEVTEPEPQLPDGEDFREGETPLPQGFSSISNDPREVQKILASFLSAESLEQRKDFLSAESVSNPKTVSSPLAGPIPTPATTLFMDVLTDEQEKRTDFFYVVGWAGEDNTPAKPMAVELHKWPGSEPPRIHSEAFLEFYQQKLARYAANPLDRPARFFVLGECVAKCFETEEVADHATKATLKLGTFPNDRNPVKAYFNKKGEILEQLKAYRSGLAFRKGIPMTVTLAWSDPSPGSIARYLEVRMIDSFDWHP
ncbi:MAG: hypothetical protein ACSHYB_01185 [Roseibacillus sp.]